MANYLDFLKNITNPFEGVIDTITKPVDEGGINILGASAPKEFEAMKTAGLLTNEEYQDALNKADMRSKRNAIVQGLLGYGLQDFNKGYGSAFDPRYLKAGFASAIPAAQKSFDELAPNVMNIEKLKEFKAAKDKESSRLAMIKDFQSGKYGTVEDGTFTKEQMALFPQLGIAQMYDMIKPKVYAPDKLQKLQTRLKGLTPGSDEYNEVKGAINKLTTKEPTSLQIVPFYNEQTGKMQKYQIPKGDLAPDNNGDGIPDNFVPVGDPYSSTDTKDISSASANDIRAVLGRIKNKELGFIPTGVVNTFNIANDIASVAEQIGRVNQLAGTPINSAAKINQAIELFKKSGALIEGSWMGVEESYDSNKFTNYIQNELTGKTKENAKITNLSNGNILITGKGDKDGEYQILPDGTYKKVK